MIENNSRITHVVWDWNGTLFNDVDAAIKVMNRLLSARTLPQIESKEAYHKVFCFPVIRYYEALGFSFEAEPFEIVADEFVRLYEAAISQSSLFSNTESVLKKLRAEGITQAVISASSQSSLERQMRPFQIEGYFADILGIAGNLAHSKEAIAKEWFQHRGISPSNALFVGDTDHDMQVAESVGCSAVLIANGHQSAKKLQKTGAHVLHDIQEFPDFILR